MPSDVNDRVGREYDDPPTEEQYVEEMVSQHLAQAVENAMPNLAQ
jgi:hypothetical protein